MGRLSVGSTSAFSDMDMNTPEATQHTPVPVKPKTTRKDPPASSSEVAQRDLVQINVGTLRNASKSKAPTKTVEVALPLELIKVAEELEIAYLKETLIRISWAKICSVALDANLQSSIPYSLNWLPFHIVRLPASSLVEISLDQPYKNTASERLAGWLENVRANGYLISE